MCIIAAAIYGRAQNIAEGIDFFCTGGFHAAAGTLSRMNIAAEHILGIRQDRFCVVRKYDFCFRALFFDQLCIVIHIIHACEGMLFIAEGFAVLLDRKHVGIRIDAGCIQNVLVEKMVADFVCRIAQHQNNLLGTSCNAAQADCKAVAALDRENDADGLTAEFRPDVRRYVIRRSIVAVRTGNNGFRHSDDIALVQFEAILLCRRQDRIRDDFDDIVPLPYNGRFNAS